jgi:hypothetical protein
MPLAGARRDEGTSPDMNYRGLEMVHKQDILPIKTRIVVWWLVVVGIATMILGTILIPVNLSAGYGEDSPTSAPVAVGILVLALILPSIINVISGTMLIKRKKQARTLSITSLSVESILCLVAFIIVCTTDGPSIAAIFICALALCLVPLLLLILDQCKTKSG